MSQTDIKQKDPLLTLMKEIKEYARAYSRSPCEAKDHKEPVCSAIQDFVVEQIELDRQRRGDPVAWPKTAAEIRDFIDVHYISMAGADDPSDDDKYTLTAHDLLSAFRWWTGFAPQPAEPVVKESLTVPDGWQLVPIEPTEAMLNQGESEWSSRYEASRGYLAMLQAAPNGPDSPKRLEDMSKAELIDLIESERDKHQIELDAIGAGEW